MRISRVRTIAHATIAHATTAHATTAHATTAHATTAHATTAPAGGEALGVLVHRVAKAWRSELDRRLRPLGLTRAQWQALAMIARADHALTQRELAQGLDIGAPATVSLIDRMERAGLVERVAVPGDRRRNAVRATRASRRLLGRIETTACALRREILGGFSRAELLALQALLARTLDHVESLRAPSGRAQGAPPPRGAA